MKLFNRKNNTAAAIPEDLQPYYSNKQSGIKRWTGPILRILLLLAVLALLIFGVSWLVRQFTKDDPKNAAGQTSSQNIPDPAAEKPAGDQGKTGTSSTSTAKPAAPAAQSPTTPGSGSAATPGTAAAPAAGSGPDTLANAGPTETFALFAVVTMVGAFVHRLYTVRKLGS
ncbi:MAG TPA: hypothetical protein VF575_05145 [Candidatus Saccharimonadales bacterium]